MSPGFAIFSWDSPKFSETSSELVKINFYNLYPWTPDYDGVYYHYLPYDHDHDDPKLED